jgi:hypothetical protein
MLYRVKWELISWTNFWETIAELTQNDVAELEKFFAKEVKEHRLMGYGIQKYTPMRPSDLYAEYRKDQANERDLEEESDEGSPGGLDDFR